MAEVATNIFLALCRGGPALLVDSEAVAGIDLASEFWRQPGRNRTAVSGLSVWSGAELGDAQRWDVG